MNLFERYEMLEKIEMVLSEITTKHGFLKADYAQEFIHFLVCKSNLLQLVTVVPMDSLRKQVYEVDDSLREKVDDVVEVFPAHKELCVKLLIGEVSVDRYKFCESLIKLSIYQKVELREILFSYLAEFIIKDIEDLVINGDTRLANPYLAILDGILKVSSKNVVNACGRCVDINLLREMLQALPLGYRKDRRAMRFLVSDSSEYDYRENLEKRSAGIFGCSVPIEKTAVSAFGIKIERMERFPEDLGVYNNKTVVLLCNPKNIHVGIWRKIRLNLMKAREKDELNIVASLHLDVKHPGDVNTVKAINVGIE
jgi:hypothetical protein